MVKIIPRGEWVLVKQNDEKKRETEQGLILPPSEDQEQKAQGTVISIGTKVTDIPAGSTVIFGAYAGEHLKTMEDGKEVEYKLLLDEDIIAFIE